jgi:hypothetical protein
MLFAYERRGRLTGQPYQLGRDIGIVGGLDRRKTDPSVPAQRRKRDEGSATSTANNGMASRAKVLREPIGADAHPLGGVEGNEVAGGDTVRAAGGAATPCS